MTERWGFRTYLGVPLMVGERRFGILTLMFHRRRVFGTEDLELVEIVAAQVALAIQHARLYADTRSQARQLATILDVNRRLALGPDLDQILARITEEAASLLEQPGRSSSSSKATPWSGRQPSGRPS